MNSKRRYDLLRTLHRYQFDRFGSTLVEHCERQLSQTESHLFISEMHHNIGLGRQNCDFGFLKSFITLHHYTIHSIPTAHDYLNTLRHHRRQLNWHERAGEWLHDCVTATEWVEM